MALFCKGPACQIISLWLCPIAGADGGGGPRRPRRACAHLGDVSRGGDPHLWTKVLQYFGLQQYDCSTQVAPLDTFRHARLL